MKVIYVAGPFDGPTAWDTECNIRRAEELALEVWKLGHAAICPHANTRFYTGVLPRESWLKGDIEILHRCDALLLVPNWTKSNGTKGEIAECAYKNIPVFANLDELKEWLCQ